MKKKNILVLAAAIFLIVAFANLFVLSRHSCTTIEKIDATLAVKIIPGRAMLGLNTDTEALHFGVVSPGIAAMRKVTIQHSEDATVKARMEGELASWTSISPSEFTVLAGKATEVAFEVSVPQYALPGNYTGTAFFCIKE